MGKKAGKKKNDADSGGAAPGSSVNKPFVLDAATLDKLNLNSLIPEGKKAFRIINAKIKDQICDYEYEVLEGIGTGRTHTVKGTEIVHKDMVEAFKKLHVHYAYFDDVFKNKGIEIERIDDEHDNEITHSYTVTGFKIVGSSENEKVVLIGYKHISVGGVMYQETPKILIDGSGLYQWYNELVEAIELVRFEVEQYEYGKCEPPDAPYVDPNQTNLLDELAAAEVKVENKKEKK